MKSPGKKFEEDIKKSVPPNTWYYRFRDGTANFVGAKNDNVRFQQTNICDCQLYNEGLFLFELKSHLGKSLPHGQFKSSTGKIKHLPNLVEAMMYGITAGAIINMREVNETYFLYADTILDHIYAGERKSIPLEFMRKNGFRVKSELLIKRYWYDIKDLLEQIRLDR